jgi:hypothetical protein
MADALDALKISSISIERSLYAKDKPFIATVKLDNSWNNTAITVKMDEQETLSLISLIAPRIQAEVAKQMSNLLEEATRLALPAAQAPAIEASPLPPSPPVMEQEDDPFVPPF